MAYKDTLTVTRLPDGTWQAKLHGYPFLYNGENARDCLHAAGEAIDQSFKVLEKIKTLEFEEINTPVEEQSDG